GRGAQSHDAPDRELRRLLRELLPGEEGLARRLVAGRQEGVGRGHGDEAVRLLGREAKADEPSPVLADERRLAQIDGREEALHPIDVTLVRVVLTPGRLVRAAEADEIGRDRAEPRGGEDRDQIGRASWRERDERRRW